MILLLVLLVLLPWSMVALGTVASITGIFPAEHAGDVFLFLAFSFLTQNLVVASRSLWHGSRAIEVTA